MLSEPEGNWRSKQNPAMKPLLLSLLAFAFLTTVSVADVAVYNGIQVIKTTSGDGTSTIVEKTIEVVDLSTSAVSVITLGKSGPPKSSVKTFSIAAPAGVQITTVQDSRNKRTFTNLSQVSTATDITTGITEMSSFIQSGQNLQVVIKGTEKTSLPRNMHGTYWIVSTAGGDVNGDIASARVDTVITLVLQEATSRVSNNAGDTLAQAVDRIKADLVAKGYVEVVP